MKRTRCINRFAVVKFVIILVVIILVLNCSPSDDKISAVSEPILKAVTETGPAEYISEKVLEGDWFAQAHVTAAGDLPHAAFVFAKPSPDKRHIALHLYPDRTELVRQEDEKSKILSSYPGAGGLPWRFSARKRGAYYFFEVNGSYLGFTFHPSANIGATGRVRTVTEPEGTSLGMSFPSPGKHELQEFIVRPISLGERQADPIAVPGRKGSWNEAEAFPGAVLRHDDLYYLYLNGTDWTSEKLEGGGNTRVGLATSRDLYHWDLAPGGVVLDLGPEGAWDSTLVMVNGAVSTPDGRFAVTYMGFDGKTWSGIGLATSLHPTGPFIKHPENPVLGLGSWEIMMHEHTLYRDQDHYILFYTGFDGNGDRGGIATSEDLVHWIKDPTNPVFLPEGPDRFDSLHLRPRSLFRLGDYYYLFYEGAGTRPKFSPDEGGVQFQDQLIFDSIGLARSKDLHLWERHPWNPIIPPTGGTSFDALWTGWPHAVLRPDGLFVLYAASDAWGFAKKQGRVCSGLIRFDFQELENWLSEH